MTNQVEEIVNSILRSKKKKRNERVTGPVTAVNIKRIIKEAWPDPKKLSSVALAYIAALNDTEAMYGEEGLRVQASYIASNLIARTPEQKTAKRLLQAISEGGD